MVRTFDASGRVIKVTEPSPPGAEPLITDLSYDSKGRVTQIIQRGRRGDLPRVRTFEYDASGHVTSATSPEAGTTTYTYDANGNIHSKKDALGQTVTYTWDGKKRLTQKTFSDGTSSSNFEFDKNAERDYSSYRGSQDRKEALRAYHFDDKGRLLSLRVESPDPANQSFTLNVRYDDAHRTKYITYPDGTVVQQAFTRNGLLESLFYGSTLLYSRPEYFVPSGRLNKVTLGNGLTYVREYDRHNRVQRTVLTSPTGVLMDESLEYTGWGSVKHVADNLRPINDLQFKYDHLQRVTATEGTAEEKYAYDSFGNRALKVSGAVSQSFDEHNPFTAGEGISYDANGQVTNDGVHSYSYDGNGLITSVDGGSIRYFYDAEGNRIRKQMKDGNHEYIWWNDQLMAERGPDGVWTDYVYVNGGRFASIRSGSNPSKSTGDVAFFVTSAVGASRMNVSAGGVVLAKGTFSAFGKPATVASGGAEIISFSDEVHDPETGLDTYKFRSYNPRLGRWMSPDPSSLHFASMGNPQTYNLYAYVVNDPLKYVDSLGLSRPPCDGYDWGDGDYCDDGGGGGGGGGGWDDPPPGDDPPPSDPTPPSDPCAGADACVVATPDPPVDPDPDPVDVGVYCTGGFCFSYPGDPGTPDDSPDDPAPGTLHTLPPHDPNHPHALTIRMVSGQNGNPAGHVTVQLDSGPEVGFGPTQNMTKSQLASNTSVLGQVEPRSPNASTLDAVTIYLTDAEMATAQAVISDRTANPGNYQWYGRSCVDFGEDVLRSTGAPAPSDTLPSYMVFDIRSRQYADNTQQAP